MAGKTAVLTLAGEKYTVHAFNLGELEELTEATANGLPGHKLPFFVIRMALRRAEPKVEDAGLLEISADEIGAASPILLELAGMRQADPNVQAATKAA